MKKTFLALVFVALSSFITGCATATPESLGVATGTAAYLAYSQAAEGKDQEFRDNVAALWRTVDAINDVNMLIVRLHELDVMFDRIIAYDKLSDKDRKALQAIRDMVLRNVYDKVSGKVDDSSSAVQYLNGVRKGVNNMILIYGVSSSSK